MLETSLGALFLTVVQLLRTDFSILESPPVWKGRAGAMPSHFVNLEGTALGCDLQCSFARDAKCVYSTGDVGGWHVVKSCFARVRERRHAEVGLELLCCFLSLWLQALKK